MNKTFFNKIILFCAVLAFAGCSSQQQIEKISLPQKSTQFLIERAIENEFTYEWLSAKLSADAEWGEQGGQFKINLRIKHDSAIWISMTPALGIEVARLLITRDSIYFLDKMKRQYYVAEYDALEDLINTELPFRALENLLVGNSIEQFETDKFKSYNDDVNYILLAKNKRKVRQALNRGKKDVYNLSTDSAFADQVNNKKLEKARDKLDEEDLIIKRYWLNPDNYRISRTLIDDIMEKSSMLIQYDNFDTFDNQVLPKEAIITLSAPEQSAVFKFEYLRLETGEPQTFPFTIPKKYEPFK